MTLCFTPLAWMGTVFGVQEAELPLPPGNMGRAVYEWLDRKALTLHLWEAVTEGELRKALPLTQEPTGQGGAPPSSSIPSPPASDP